MENLLGLQIGQPRHQSIYILLIKICGLEIFLFQEILNTLQEVQYKLSCPFEYLYIGDFFIIFFLRNIEILKMKLHNIYFHLVYNKNLEKVGRKG